MYKLVFDPATNRWLNYFKDNVDKGYIWQNGYDDPTYLTFKVEFGDWGASVLDRSIIDKGTTTFSLDNADYDQLPLGLMNCPFGGSSNNDLRWGNGQSSDYNKFNDIREYSAFQYLRSRNEDVRAEYIYHFVNGLYEIQKSAPYIFKRITGVDQLEQHDPNTRQRVKDVKISLECIEGLDLKIRTLMELYRKAAWDDVYQRWILPENMRQFKMIIYVFERRVFQSSSWQLDPINYDLPVKTYECSPCEFALGSYWNGDYDSEGTSGEAATTLNITVKNVRTYYQNGLLNNGAHADYINHNNASNTSVASQNIDKLFIYDLVDRLDRIYSEGAVSEDNPLKNYSITSGKTINGVRAMFMNKKVFLSNEAFAHPEIKDTTWTTQSINMPSMDGDAYYNTIGYAIGEVLKATAANKSIMLGSKKGLIGDTLNMETAFNFMEKNSRVSDNVFGIDMYQPLQVMLEPRYQQFQSLYALFDPGRPIFDYGMYSPLPPRMVPDQDLLVTGDPRQLDNQNFAKLNDPRQIPDQDLLNPGDPRDLVDQDLLNPGDPRQLPDQQYPEIGERKPVDQDLLNPGDPRQLPDQQYPEIYHRDLVDQELLNPGDPRELPNQQYPEIASRELPDQDLLTPGDPRELPDQQYPKIANRKLPEQELLNPGGPRELPNQQYPEIGKPRNIPQNVDELILQLRQIPGLQDVKIEDLRDIPAQNLVDLSKDLGRVLPEFKVNRLDLINMINNSIDKPNEHFLTIDQELRNDERFAIDSLKHNSALQHLIPNDNNSDAKRRQSLLKFAQDYVLQDEKIKADYAEHVIKLKERVKSLSIDAVRALPEVDMYTLKEKGRDVPEQALISVNDARTIGDNIKLVSLQDADIREMSMTALVTLNNMLEQRAIETQALIGLTDKIEHREQTPIAIDTKSLISDEKMAAQRKRLGHSKATEMSSMKDKGRKKSKKIVY